MSDAKKYTSKLSGARVLIIGGTSGIGYSVAEASLESGASVILASSQESKVKSSIDTLLKTYPSAKDRVSGHACNLAVPALEENIQQLFKKTGTVDHIVFTAGDAIARIPIGEATLETIQQAGMVRFFAPLLVAKHAPKYLSAGPTSSLTLTTGSVSEKPVAGWSIPASYGSGLHAMTRSLALDLAPIRVNLISPGAVETPLWDHVMSKEQIEGFKAQGKKTHTTGQLGQPEDVAEAYLFVMKDKNCTGAMISTNGGAPLL